MYSTSAIAVDVEAISKSESQLEEAFSTVRCARARLWLYKLCEMPSSGWGAKFLAVFSVVMILLLFAVMVCQSIGALCPATAKLNVDTVGNSSAVRARTDVRWQRAQSGGVCS